MTYEQFHTAWYEALTEAGMWSFLSPPTETVDLGQMRRTYQVYVHLGRSQQVEPFHVTASLSWTWDALQAARSATREEDVLIALLDPSAMPPRGSHRSCQRREGQVVGRRAL